MAEWMCLAYVFFFLFLKNSLSYEWINSGVENTHFFIFAHCFVFAHRILFLFVYVCVFFSVFVLVLRNVYDLMKFFRRDVENATHLRANLKQNLILFLRMLCVVCAISFFSSIFIAYEKACQKCHFLLLTFFFS